MSLLKCEETPKKPEKKEQNKKPIEKPQIEIKTILFYLGRISLGICCMITTLKYQRLQVVQQTPAIFSFK